MNAEEEELKRHEQYFRHVERAVSRRRVIFVEVHRSFPSPELSTAAVEASTFVANVLPDASEKLTEIERAQEFHNDARRQIEEARLGLVRAQEFISMLIARSKKLAWDLLEHKTLHETYNSLAAKLDSEPETKYEDLEEALHRAKQGYKEELDDAQRKADSAVIRFQLLNVSSTKFWTVQNDPILSLPGKINLSDAAPFIGLLLAEGCARRIFGDSSTRDPTDADPLAFLPRKSTNYTMCNRIGLPITNQLDLQGCVRKLVQRL